MKFPIEWHEECLKNSRASAEHKRAEVKREMEQLDRLDEGNRFYEAQIERAKFQHKDGFDRDKFMKSHKKGS